MNALSFQLITPDGVKFEDDVYEVILPTVTGQIGILPNHESLIALAVPGVIFVRKNQSMPDSQMDHFASGGGVIHINNNRIRFLADTAEHADAIDELRAKQALERARELQRTAEDHITIADATGLIERNLVRLKVAELRRRHSHQPHTS
jgi:F-type H+-transporting ATPase subunit epsilon